MAKFTKDDLKPVPATDEQIAEARAWVQAATVKKDARKKSVAKGLKQAKALLK